MTESFRASAQYNDYTGTSAADEADLIKIRNHLESKGLVSKQEIVYGVELYVGIQVEEPQVRVFLYDIGTHSDLPTALADVDVPEFRVVDLEISLSEFFQLFKRFSVYLGRRDLFPDGFEYTTK